MLLCPTQLWTKIGPKVPHDTSTKQSMFIYIFYTGNVSTETLVYCFIYFLVLWKSVTELINLTGKFCSDGILCYLYLNVSLIRSTKQSQTLTAINVFPFWTYVMRLHVNVMDLLYLT